MKFLSERGLAFRGENKTPYSSGNGNFLHILELLAEYDSSLAKHIEEKAQKGKGHQYYLLSTISDELILQMGKDVLDLITTDLKQIKYHSISIDSTPDNARVDQLTLVVQQMDLWSDSSHLLL